MTAVLVVALSLTSFLVGFLCLPLESSELQSDHWWHDLYSSSPGWVTFFGLSGASALLLFYRKIWLSLLVTMISLGMIWALVTGHLLWFFDMIPTVQRIPQVH